eukprot:TRINITY_DN14141_c0_g2_i2.p1 TRINITY_DN14141_c0_g2~~TRINITY_DN14141_c0_g2_i2.p1  ORF type:complete len:860 (+),score=96.11 TRINITY_DN14141_c0_g2_i2:72-2651(+)
MTFFDIWNNAGSFIQSFFAWGTFNRDAFVDNVAMRQVQKYQQKNYSLSWITIARDDVRDMMGISVNRINNYMVVATLILGVAASAVTGVTFDPEVPDFVVYAFNLSIGNSIIYLTLTIMFGVKGQNSAFTNTMKLLTYKIRPEPPAEYNHDYMKQAQYIEALGPSQLFRIPGTKPAYHCEDNGPALRKKMQQSVKSTFGRSGSSSSHHAALPPGWESAEDPSTNCIFYHNRSTGVSQWEHPGATSGHDVMLEKPNAEDATPLESLTVSSPYLWYLAKFARFMRLWLPYDTYAKYSMGLGIIALGQGSAYFTLGKLVGESHRKMSYWAVVAMTCSMMYLVVLVTVQNFSPKNVESQIAIYALLMGGPLLLTVASTTQHVLIELACVPLSYLTHVFFWFSVFLLAQREMTDPQLNFKRNGTLDFWDSSKKQYQEKGGLLVDARQQHQGSVIGRQTTERSKADYDWKDGQWESASRASPEHGDSDIVGEMGGEEDHWPTDDVAFEERSASLDRQTKWTLRQTLFLSAVLWMALFGWAAGKYYSVVVEPDVTAPGGRSSLSTPASSLLMGEVAVQWPALFWPHSVACAGDGSVFLADKTRIYQMVGGLAGGSLRHIRCDTNGSIADISVACNADGCEPVALIRGSVRSPSKIVLCSQDVSQPLLQNPVPADLLDVRAAASVGGVGVWTEPIERQRLLVAHTGDLVQYASGGPRQGYNGTWTPEWFVGAVGKETPLGSRQLGVPRHRAGGVLRAIDTFGGALMLFFDGARANATSATGSVQTSSSTSHQHATVDVRDAASMKRMGSWSLPASVGNGLLGGCALAGGTALVLPASIGEGSLQGSRPRLVRLRLPRATDSSDRDES